MSKNKGDKMEMATMRRRETGQPDRDELSERKADLHAGAAAMLGPEAVWASIPNQPPLSPELEAERAEFVQHTYGRVDQE
jgi:hypothetical protein